MCGRAPPHTALTIRVVPVILVAGLITTTHAYVAHPRCTSGRGWAGGFSCAFNTYQQCLENARLYDADCVAHPAIDRSRRLNRVPLSPTGADAGVRPAASRNGARSAGSQSNASEIATPETKTAITSVRSS